MGLDVARTTALRRGITPEGVPVVYDTLEGLIAVAAGLAAGSVALTGFGIDSVIEVTSGDLLWWRHRSEMVEYRVEQHLAKLGTRNTTPP